MPPGNFPAHAKMMARNFAAPTCRAADGLANGRDGLTKAEEVTIELRPCLVAANAVLCPSTTHCKLPSPQKSVVTYMS